jgi:hypothetical protein
MAQKIGCMFWPQHADAVAYQLPVRQQRIPAYMAVCNRFGVLSMIICNRTLIVAVLRSKHQACCAWCPAAHVAEPSVWNVREWYRLLCLIAVDE